MQTSTLEGSQSGPPTSFGLRRFAGIQVVVWSAYAAALMIPWLGEYSVAAMLPNKFIVASMGIAVSSGLPAAYRAVGMRPPLRGRDLLTVFVVSLVAGLVLEVVFQETFGVGTRGGGAAVLLPSRRGAWMPEFGGAGYQALVMVAWSLGYVVLSNGRLTGTSSRPPAPVDNERSAAVQPDAAAAPDSAIVYHEGKLRIRDAGQVIYIDPSDVEMISADGDYVRVHVHGKRLLVRETLTRVAVALDGTEYVRIHRSTVVNERAISQVSRRPNSELLLVLRSGLQVRASRSFAPGLRGRLGVR
jgi:hypothetical protein